MVIFLNLLTHICGGRLCALKLFWRISPVIIERWGVPIFLLISRSLVVDHTFIGLVFTAATTGSAGIKWFDDFSA